jgi:branched-chain amino acid aminotransferase
LVIIPEYKKTDPSTYTKGVKIGRVPNIRPNDDILSPHYNTLSKLNCILASIEANKLGYDEGIMNDMSGNISTCNSTNLFFIKQNQVLTSTGQYCLNGITRGKAIQVCTNNDIPISEIDFTFDDIKNCDEAFVTGTFAGIIPVSKIENTTLKSNNKNSLTLRIKKLYDDNIISYIQKNKL